jgi:hypothetical protein
MKRQLEIYDKDGNVVGTIEIDGISVSIESTNPKLEGIAGKPVDMRVSFDSKGFIGDGVRRVDPSEKNYPGGVIDTIERNGFYVVR